MPYGPKPTTTAASRALVARYTPEYCAALLDLDHRGVERLFEIAQGFRVSRMRRLNRKKEYAPA